MSLLLPFQCQFQVIHNVYLIIFMKPTISRKQREGCQFVPGLWFPLFILTECGCRVFMEQEGSFQSGRPGSNCLCCSWTVQKWRRQLTSRCFHFLTQAVESRNLITVLLIMPQLKKQKISSLTIIRCNTWKHPELVSMQWILASFSFFFYTLGLL